MVRRVMMMVHNGMELATRTQRAIELGLDKGRRTLHTIMASSPPARRIWRGRRPGFAPLWIAAGLLAGTAILLMAWRRRTASAPHQETPEQESSETADTDASPYP